MIVILTDTNGRVYNEFVDEKYDPTISIIKWNSRYFLFKRMLQGVVTFEETKQPWTVV